MGEQLGEKIRQLRTAAEITLRDAAKRLGVQPPHLSDIEHGRRNPSPELMGKIATLLKVDVGELEALDSRIAESVKRKVEEDPAYGQLFRTMVESNINPEEWLAKLKKKKGS